MKIAILGDSWGVPNWYDPPTGVFWPAESHIEFLLKNAGHEVTNFAKSSGNNVESLQRLKSAIEKKVFENVSRKREEWCEIQLTDNYDCDLVIWFFTEWIRNLCFDTKKINFSYTLQELEKQELEKTFALAKSLKDKMTAKWLVIGGQSAILDRFDLKDVPDFLIRDWKSEITKKDLPYAHFTVMHDYLIQYVTTDRCTDTFSDKEQFFKNVEIILQSLRDCDKIDFPDSAHPGPRPHQNLFNYIKTILE